MILKSYKIGVSAPLSGCEGEHGKQMVRAVELAIDEFNQNNRKPYSIEIIVGNDKGETEEGKKVAESFVSDLSIMGVVGPLNSNPSDGAAPLYNQAGLVCITNGASNATLTTHGYKSFFRIIANDDFQGSALIDFISNYLKVSKISIINDNTDFSSGLGGLVHEKASARGLKIIDHLEISFGKEDYKQELSALDLSSPEVIFFAILEPEGKIISRQLREAGNKSIFLGTDALKPSKFLYTPGYDVPGPYHSCATTDINREKSAFHFAELFEKKYNEKYSIYTAEAYDAANLLINAIDSTDDPNRENVLQKIRNTKDYQGASGKITFTDSGELKDPKISFYYYKNGDLCFLGFSDSFI